MPKFEKIAPSKALEVIPPPVERHIEPRCSVCTHKQRDQIDRLLAMRTPYSDIERAFSTEEKKLDRRSVSNHNKKHVRYEDEAVRRIIEYEAGLAQEDLEMGVQGAFLRRTTLDVAIKKVFDGIISGETELEAKDVVKMIELRERLDQNSASAQVEQYKTQFLAFKTAIEEICPPEMMFDILTRTKELLKLDTPELQASQ